MTNNEEMRSAQTQSQTNQPPEPPEPPEIPKIPEKAIALFKQIEQGVIGKAAQPWVFQGEQPPNPKVPIPNPKTKFSEPVSCPPGQSK
jgi:hypothetical protein